MDFKLHYVGGNLFGQRPSIILCFLPSGTQTFVRKIIVDAVCTWVTIVQRRILAFIDRNCKDQI